jgi:VWFA-related protein
MLELRKGESAAMADNKIISRREMLLGTASIVVGARCLHSQESPQAASPKFSVDVEVVNAFVTVRDKKGAIVKDLMREDFTLSEDGRSQTIQYFSRESNLPLTIGLVVDTTPSESNMLEEERSASRIFLNSMLRPEKDTAFLIQYSNEIELLQDVTSSREKLEKALNLLERHSLERNNRGRGRSMPQRPSSRRSENNPYATVLADAVYLASDEIMELQEGRKALIILGDGDHVGDRMEEAITAAQKSDTMIYAIRIYDKDFESGGGGPGGPGRFPPAGGPGGKIPGGGGGGPFPGGGRERSDGKENLQTLSRRTGGAYFEVSKKETLEKIYSQIEEELRSQYSLGYTPEANARSGYRRIEVGIKRKDMIVHGRDGYYPKTKH